MKHKEGWFLMHLLCVAGTRPVTCEVQTGLENHMDDALIEFRDMRVRRLHP